MISKTLRLEIANICYANVANRFAMFQNPDFRGDHFTWDDFAEMCAGQAAGWMFIHNVRGHSEESVKNMAADFSREIAQTLVDQMRQ